MVKTSVSLYDRSIKEKIEGRRSRVDGGNVVGTGVGKEIRMCVCVGQLEILKSKTFEGR